MSNLERYELCLAGSTEFAEDINALSELHSWTQIEDVLAACRIIEGRALPSDDPSHLLKLRFPLDQELSTAWKFLIDCFLANYKCPNAKIGMACRLDPRIREDTVEKIVGGDIPVLLVPEIQDASAIFQKESSWADAYVQGPEWLIQLVINPLRCLNELILTMAAQMGPIRARELQKHIFHQSNMDGALAYTVEQRLFQATGFLSGAQRRNPGQSGVYNGFRFCAVLGPPPLDPVDVEAAQVLHARMMPDD